MMISQEKLHQFVDGLLTSAHDREMNVYSRPEPEMGRTVLAASSENAVAAPVRKIGVLSDRSGDLLIRIYQNQPEQCYQLYLLGADNLKTDHALMSFRQSFKCFMSTAGRVDIPFSSGINPLEDPPCVALPVDELRVEMQYLTNPLVAKTSRGCDCHLEWDRTTDKLEIVLGNPARDVSYSRLIVITDSRHREQLVPVRNGRAQMSLENTCEAGIMLHFYE